MKPKEGLTKWLLLLLVASNYVKSEYFMNHEDIPPSNPPMKLDNERRSTDIYGKDLKGKLNNDFNVQPQSNEPRYSNRRHNIFRTRLERVRNFGNDLEKVNSILRARQARTDISRLTPRNLNLERSFKSNRYSTYLQRVRKDAGQRNLKMSDRASESNRIQALRRLEMFSTENGQRKYFGNKIASEGINGLKFRENRDVSDTRGKKMRSLESTRIRESSSKDEERIARKRIVLQLERFNRARTVSKRSSDLRTCMSRTSFRNEENQNQVSRSRIDSCEKSDELSFRSNSVLRLEARRQNTLDTKRRNDREFRLETESLRKVRSITDTRKEKTIENGQRVKFENNRRERSIENRHRDRTSGNGRSERKVENGRRERVTFRLNEENIRLRCNARTITMKERHHGTRASKIVRESENRRQEVNQARRRNNDIQKNILDDETNKVKSTRRIRQDPNVSRHFNINYLRISIDHPQSERRILTERNNRIRERNTLRMRAIEEENMQLISNNRYRVAETQIKDEQDIRTVAQNIKYGIRSRVVNRGIYEKRGVFRINLDEKDKPARNTNLLKAVKNAENTRNSLFRSREKRDTMPARKNVIFSSNRNNELSRQRDTSENRLFVRAIEHFENKNSRSNWRQVDERLVRDSRDRNSLTNRRNDVLRKKMNNDLRKRSTEGRRMQSMKFYEVRDNSVNKIPSFRSNERALPSGRKNERMFTREIIGRVFRGKVYDARPQNGNNNSIMTLRNLELRSINIKFLRNNLRIENLVIKSRQVRNEIKERNRELQRSYIRAQTREIRKLHSQGNEKSRRMADISNILALDRSRETRRMVMNNPNFQRALYRNQGNIGHRKLHTMPQTHNTIRQAQIISNANIQESERKSVTHRRERNIESERNGRGFRGKVFEQDRHTAKAIRMKTRQNVVDRLRVLFHSRNYDILDQKRKQSHALPNERNGRGYRGKVERNALEIIAMHREFHLKTAGVTTFSSVTNRKINQLQHSSNIPTSQNIAQISFRLQEFKAKRRISNDETASARTSRRSIRTLQSNPPDHKQRSVSSRRIHLDKRISILQATERLSKLDSLLRSSYHLTETRKYLAVRKDQSNDNLSSSGRTVLNKAVDNLEQTQRRFRSQLRSRYTRSNNKELNQEFSENISYQNIRNVGNVNSHSKLKTRLERTSLLEKIHDRQVSVRSRLIRNSLRERKMRIILAPENVRNTMKGIPELGFATVFQVKDEESSLTQVYSSAFESVSMPGNNIFEKHEQHGLNSLQKHLADAQNYWDISGRNAVSLLVNILIGLLVLVAMSQEHRQPAKPKPFKERLSDFLLLRS